MLKKFCLCATIKEPRDYYFYRFRIYFFEYLPTLFCHMKIAIISHLKYPIKEPFAGGLEMHTHALADGLIRRGHQVQVFASADSDKCLNLGPMNLSALSYESTKDFEPNPDKFSEQFVREHHAYLELMLQLADGDFDVVQNNSLNYIPLSMASTISTPMVTTLHTPPFSWMQSAVRCERKRASVEYVTVSQQNARLWEGYLDDCPVIYNGINLDKWRYSARAEPETAVWFGRIVPEKGTHLAVKAAHEAGLRFHFAGPICDQQYFDKEVQPLLDSSDTYHGHLCHRELIDLIGMCSVFLCTPCWEEPYGLVVAEALACGTPVAAFRRGALPEIVDINTGRFALPDDVSSLAKAAREAITLRRIDCRQRAEQVASMERMVDEYVDLYTEVAHPVALTCQAG